MKIKLTLRGRAREDIDLLVTTDATATVGDVAAALASGTLTDARVQITSDPDSTENIHRISLKNNLMRAELTVAGKPDPANPKSSTSTAWSVVALLKNLASPVQFF